MTQELITDEQFDGLCTSFVAAGFLLGVPATIMADLISNALIRRMYPLTETQIGIALARCTEILAETDRIMKAVIHHEEKPPVKENGAQEPGPA